MPITRCPTRDPLALTPREQQIVDMLVQGYTYQEMGRILGIAYNTTTNHIRSIYEKTDVHTQTRLVLWALRRQAAGVR